MITPPPPQITRSILDLILFWAKTYFFFLLVVAFTCDGFRWVCIFKFCRSAPSYLMLSTPTRNVLWNAFQFSHNPVSTYQTVIFGDGLGRGGWQTRENMITRSSSCYAQPVSSVLERGVWFIIINNERRPIVTVAHKRPHECTVQHLKQKRCPHFSSTLS